jgi:predicted HTH transcriptional regulator
MRLPWFARAWLSWSERCRWGRGTNRVVAECLAHGVSPPLFEEQQGWVVVTFRASIVPMKAGKLPPEGKEKSKEKGKEKGREKGREKMLRLVAESSAITIQGWRSPSG